MSGYRGGGEIEFREKHRMDGGKRKGIGVSEYRCVGVVVDLRYREKIWDDWMIGGMDGWMISNKY